MRWNENGPKETVLWWVAYPLLPNLRKRGKTMVLDTMQLLHKMKETNISGLP
jgi:hypothetical protein